MKEASLLKATGAVKEEEEMMGESLKPQAKESALDSGGNLELPWDLEKGNGSMKTVFYKISQAG